MMSYILELPESFTHFPLIFNLIVLVVILFSCGNGNLNNKKKTTIKQFFFNDFSSALKIYDCAQYRLVLISISIIRLQKIIF